MATGINEKSKQILVFFTRLTAQKMYFACVLVRLAFKLTIAQIGKAYEEAGLSARAGEIVKLKRRDAAKAAEQDLNAQGWLPDWMVRTSPTAEAEEATETDAHTTDHAA
ncbi:hypothetical protein QCN16_24030 [Enterobacter kobei]|uniref:hypothetical protein n=1 Tax=Enterobacter kobei TaxID=208224 RepID=UPI002FD84A38